MATYYVDSAATGAADGSSEADAWTTIDTAMNNVTGGDKVWVKASGTYSEQATIDTAGGQQTPVVFEGYSSTTGDNGIVAWTNSGATCLATALTSTYYIFKNFSFQNATSAFSSTTADYMTFYNCKFVSMSSHGIRGDNYFNFHNCEFTSNGGNGLDVDAGGAVTGCIFDSNTGTACQTDGTIVAFYNNVFFGKQNANGAYFNTGTISVINCTFDGEGGNNTNSVAVRAEGATQVFMADCIIYDWYIGVNLSNFPIHIQSCATNMLMNSNNTDFAETGVELLNVQGVTSAPGFTDEANDDYTLGASSPAIDAGQQPGTF